MVAQGYNQRFERDPGINFNPRNSPYPIKYRFKYFAYSEDDIYKIECDVRQRIFNETRNTNPTLVIIEIERLNSVSTPAISNSDNTQSINKNNNKLLLT